MPARRSASCCFSSAMVMYTLPLPSFSRSSTSSTSLPDTACSSAFGCLQRAHFMQTAGRMQSRCGVTLCPLLRPKLSLVSGRAHGRSEACRHQAAPDDGACILAYELQQRPEQRVSDRWVLLCEPRHAQLSQPPCAESWSSLSAPAEFLAARNSTSAVHQDLGATELLNKQAQLPMFCTAEMQMQPVMYFPVLASRRLQGRDARMRTARSGSSGHGRLFRGSRYTALLRSSTSCCSVASSGSSPFSMAFCGQITRAVREGHDTDGRLCSHDVAQ